VIPAYEHLKPAFASAAKWNAFKTGYEADDIEQEMWAVVLERGAGVVHRCVPLLSQKPAYVAKWASIYALRSLRGQSGREVIGLSEDIPAPATRVEGDFYAYVERLGEEWRIDVSEALEAIAYGEASPEFEAYIRELEPRDKRIATLLLSGLKRSHIEEQKLARRRRTKQIHRELYQILKAA
jgi:hypothetical protein